MNHQNVIYQFQHTLKLLARNKQVNFSGLGLVLYEKNSELEKFHCDLIQGIAPLPQDKLGSSNLLNYLLEISCYNHPYHDGFHFINRNGILTHVAQFFSPPIDKNTFKPGNCGARTFCSQCGSNIKGVIMIGTISSTKEIYLYENGHLVNEEKSKHYSATALAS